MLIPKIKSILKNDSSILNSLKPSPMAYSPVNNPEGAYVWPCGKNNCLPLT
jgi:hypothetical protein